MPKTRALITLPLLMLLVTSCEGVFDGIYDTPVAADASSAQIVDGTVEGTLYIDASKWDEWHYIDLPILNSHVRNNVSYDLNRDWRTYSIPMPEEGTPSETVTGHQRPGQYMCGPRMRMPSMSACPPMVVRKLFSSFFLDIVFLPISRWWAAGW